MLPHARHRYGRVFGVFFLIFFIALGGWQIGVNLLFRITGDRYLSWYRDAEIRQIYNTLLTSHGHSGDIVSLRSASIVGYESETYELIGDTLYVQSGSESDVMRAYEMSLSIRESPRIREKIRLLTAPSTEVSGEVSLSGAATLSPISSSSGGDASIASARTRIEEDESSRGDYMGRPLAPDSISEIIEFLGRGEDRVDW